MKKQTNIVLEDAKSRKLGQLSEMVGLESFTKALNKKPAVIKTNKFQNNAQYVPISHIQTLLDTLFFGLWQTKNFSFKVVANEIVGSVDLHVYHPIIKEWIVRTGVAAAQIRQNKGAVLTDINSKIKNTLEMDAPHLYANCVKSAAKTLGPAFGRDLNRDFIDNYKAIVSGYVEKNTYNTDQVIDELKTINTHEKWATYFQSNPFFQNDPNIVNLFNEKQRDLRDENF